MCTPDERTAVDQLISDQNQMIDTLHALLAAKEEIIKLQEQTIGNLTAIVRNQKIMLSVYKERQS